MGKKERKKQVLQQVFAPCYQQLKTQYAAFHPVLRIQLFCAMVMLCVVLVCRAFLPASYVALQVQYQALFEGADYTASLLRFAQQAVEAMALPANAAQDAPVGSSLQSYQPIEALVLPVETYYISSGYGWREDPFSGAWSFHSGIDFASAEGTCVYAVMDGVIEQNYYSDSYGNCICIRHADGSVTRYAHLQYAFARVGEVVCAGQQIGTVGQTGAATGAHLHFEVMVDTERQDPTAALGG